MSVVEVGPIPRHPRDLWAIRHPYDTSFINVVREVPGVWWSGKDHSWIGYRDGVRLAARKLAKAGFLLRGSLPRADDWKRANFPFPLATEGLDDFQVEAMQFCLANAAEGCLLAFAPGVGKSAPALRVARALRKRTLIVVPNPVKPVWTLDDPKYGMIRRWWPAGFPVTVDASGTTPTAHDWRPRKRQDVWLCATCSKTYPYSDVTPPKEGCRDPLGRVCPPTCPHPSHKDPLDHEAHVCVINYDVVYAWVDRLLEWDFGTLLLEECHVLARSGSQRIKALQVLREQASYCIGTTGTPMTNRVRNLFTVMSLISPGRLSGRISRVTGELETPFHPFAVRYCNAFQKEIRVRGGDKGDPVKKPVWDYSGSSHEKELAKRVSFFCLYRTKEQLGLQLPPISMELVEIDVPQKYRADLALTQGLAQTSKRDALARAALTNAAVGKLPHAVALNRSDVEGGHSVVNFVHKRAVAEALANQLAAHYLTVGCVHGGVPHAKRAEILQRARHMPTGEPFVLVATIDTMGTGLDLTFADICNLVELTYEWHKIQQIFARVHRRGQQRNVLVRVLSARGTTDDLVKMRLSEKIQNFEEIVGEMDQKIMLSRKRSAQQALDELYEAAKKKYGG